MFALAAADLYRFDFSPGRLLGLLFIALFAVAAASLLLRMIRTRQWKECRGHAVFFTLFLIIAIVYPFSSGEGDLLISRPALLLFTGVLLLTPAVILFRKLIGSAVVLLAVALITAVFLILQGFHAFTGNTLIARIQVRQVSNGSMTLDIVPEKTYGPGERTVLHLKGDRFGVIVYQVIFDNFAVFFGKHTRFRWLGMTALDNNFRQTALKLFPDPWGYRKMFQAMEKNEVRLPFIRSVQADIASKAAVNGRIYRVLIENDGGVTLEPAPAGSSLPLQPSVPVKAQ